MYFARRIRYETPGPSSFLRPTKERRRTVHTLRDVLWKVGAAVPVSLISIEVRFPASGVSFLHDINTIRRRVYTQ